MTRNKFEAYDDDQTFTANTYHDDDCFAPELGVEVHECDGDWRVTCNIHDEDWEVQERLDKREATCQHAIDRAREFMDRNGYEDVEIIEESW